VGTVRIHDRRTLFSLVWNREVGFGEAFRAGGLEVEGDLVRLLESVDRAVGLPRRRWWGGAGHGLARSRRNVHHHYDLGNDFYRLWLDREMLYTCAYFPEPCVGLEEAQRAKMDHVCLKLGLQPGQKVVEAGCGWGGFALHMARHYGVTVRAFNISREQVLWARRRASAEGLDGRVEFVEDDYRNISGRYDAFVSLGMLEHVGRENYGPLGRTIARSLDPHGRGLLHFIGRNRPAPLSAWIRRRIFPGAYPPSLREVAQGLFEPCALSVLDVENLRLHYAQTLSHWRARFEEASAAITERYGPTFFRTWRLYLAGSEAAFHAGSLQLFQVTFAPAESNSIAWTRGGLDVVGEEDAARRAWDPRKAG
jgi:cyclopropane-fatty-acyl-phospholipid synthase